MRKRQTFMRITVRGLLIGAAFAALDLLLTMLFDFRHTSFNPVIAGYVVSAFIAIDQMEGGL